MDALEGLPLHLNRQWCSSAVTTVCVLTLLTVIKATPKTTFIWNGKRAWNVNWSMHDDSCLMLSLSLSLSLSRTHTHTHTHAYAVGRHRLLRRTFAWVRVHSTFPMLIYMLRMHCCCTVQVLSGLHFDRQHHLRLISSVKRGRIDCLRDIASGGGCSSVQRRGHRRRQPSRLGVWPGRCCWHTECIGGQQPWRARNPKQSHILQSSIITRWRDNLLCWVQRILDCA